MTADLFPLISISFTPDFKIPKRSHYLIDFNFIEHQDPQSSIMQVQADPYKIKQVFIILP